MVVPAGGTAVIGARVVLSAVLSVGALGMTAGPVWSQVAEPLAAPQPASRSVSSEPATRAVTVKAERVALVIGQSRYVSLPPLNNPAHDAQDMCAALRRLAFEVHCHVDLPGRGEMRQALRRFAAALGPQTVAMFYYAGHAVQFRGENFLLPVGIAPGSAADVEDEGLALGYVLRTLEEARAVPSLIVLDACRNNPFAGTAGARATATGLARVEPPPGSLLVYATAPGGEALDGQGRNGLFTRHLLAHLERPGLRVAEMLHRVAQGVEEEARRVHQFEQIPYRSLSYAGPFCLAGCAAEDASVAVSAARLQAADAMRRVVELEAENARLDAAARAAAAASRAAATKPAAVSDSVQRAPAPAAPVPSF